MNSTFGLNFFSQVQGLILFSLRYKDDVYDRYWFLGNTNDSTQLSVSISDKNLLYQSEYYPPAIVMSTAVTLVNASAPMVISWEPKHETDEFYVYMHFMEVQVLTTNQTRQFNITLNGQSWYPNCSPQYMSVQTIYSKSGISGKEIKISLERTENSTLPPIINAIEIYKVKQFQKSDTFQGDGMPRKRLKFLIYLKSFSLTSSHTTASALNYFFFSFLNLHLKKVDAITSIKSVYGVKRDWEDDPCALQSTCGMV